MVIYLKNYKKSKEMKYSSASLNKLVQLLQSVKNASVKSFSAHNSKIHSVAWNVDGRRLASGSTDKTVAIFSFENREKLVNLKAYIIMKYKFKRGFYLNYF